MAHKILKFRYYYDEQDLIQTGLLDPLRSHGGLPLFLLELCHRGLRAQSQHQAEDREGAFIFFSDSGRCVWNQKLIYKSARGRVWGRLLRPGRQRRQPGCGQQEQQEPEHEVPEQVFIALNLNIFHAFFKKFKIYWKQIQAHVRRQVLPGGEESQEIRVG